MSKDIHSVPARFPRRDASSRRPNFVPRSGHPILSELRGCKTVGHSYEFLRFGRYGCCPKCGDEVLV